MSDTGLNQSTWLAIFGALGGAGIIGKTLEHLFSRRKRAVDEKKDLQSLVDDRLKILLDADEQRLSQMSAAINDQSLRINRLENVIQQLAGHITALESILRASRIDVPPRPAFELSE